MSPGLIARPPGMFSVVGTTPMTRIGAFEQRDRAHRAGDGRAAGHVVLHPLHAVGRLDRDAAGVERDALADQAEHRRRGRAGRIVAEHHQRAAARCCRARRRAAGPCRAAAICCSSSISTLTPASRAIAAARARELARRQRVARLVRELARQIAALAEHAAARDRRVDARRTPSSASATTIVHAAPAPAAVRRLVAAAVELGSVSPSATAWRAAASSRRWPSARTERDAARCALPRGEPRRGRQLARSSIVNSLARPAPMSATRRAFHSRSAIGVRTDRTACAANSFDASARATSPPVAASRPATAEARSSSNHGTTSRSASTAAAGR